jgi:ATP-dependent Clp protease ATP-binding subunit ClpA
MPVEPMHLLDMTPHDVNEILDRAYTDRLRRTIGDAKAFAQSRGDATVKAEHFFLSIGEDGCANAILAAEGISLRQLQDGFSVFLPDKTDPVAESRFDAASESLIACAKDFARWMNHRFLGDEHLLFALVDQSSPVSTLLRLRGLTSKTVRRQVLYLLGPGINSRGKHQVTRDPGVAGQGK